MILESGFQYKCCRDLVPLICKHVKLFDVICNLDFSSCIDVYQSGFTTTGIYKLRGMGYHYCVMGSMGECSGWGWTLVMKTHGTKVRN